MQIYHPNGRWQRQTVLEVSHDLSTMRQSKIINPLETKKRSLNQNQSQQCQDMSQGYHPKICW